MNKKYGVCDGCERTTPVNSKHLCLDCQYFKTHGQTRFEAILEKKKEQINKVVIKKKKSLKTIKKPKESEYDVFLEIWNEREHTCSNCKADLEKYVDQETGNPSAIIFSHIRGKGAAPELRRDKNNIELLCPDCHRIWEFGDREHFKARKV